MKQPDSKTDSQQQMTPLPEIIRPAYLGSNKLEGKVAIITGGDSGIGQAVAVHYAREGCDCVIVYLENDDDAAQTKQLVVEEKRRCVIVKADVSDPQTANKVVTTTLDKLGAVNILVNNAAEQTPQDSVTDISHQQFQQTFKTNIFAYFYFVKAVIPHLKSGDTIINTTSVTAYRGSGHLIDYASTKGAIVAFTRSLADSLVSQNIRVNAVAPGPVWTPLITSTFPTEQVNSFGEQVPMKRPGQPSEIAPAYVYLAAQDSSYMTGQTLHPNGGEIIGG